VYGALTAYEALGTFIPGEQDAAESYIWGTPCAACSCRRMVGIGVDAALPGLPKKWMDAPARALPRRPGGEQLLGAIRRWLQVAAGSVGVA
jgi:hypothetical protein